MKEFSYTLLGTDSYKESIKPVLKNGISNNRKYELLKGKDKSMNGFLSTIFGDHYLTC